MTTYMFDMNGTCDEADVVKFYDIDGLIVEGLIDVDTTSFCYVQSLVSVGNEHKDINIHDLFGFIWYHWDTELIALSITTQEKRFQDWIDAVSMFPEASITFINRHYNTSGEYTCAYMTIPSHLSFTRSNNV